MPNTPERYDETISELETVRKLNEDYVNSKDDQEIIALVQTSPILYECCLGGNTVFRITPSLVVKTGYELFEEAARTLEVWHYHDKLINVPRVYRCFKAHGACYMIMDFIDGAVLDSVRWEDRSPEERQSIISKLVKILDALAKHGSARCGPVQGPPTGRLFSAYGAGRNLSTIPELESWLKAKIKYHKFPVPPSPLRGDIMMCHMDLAPRNIIQDRNGALWIIDWAWAGYYPAEFEVASLITNHLDKQFQIDLKEALCHVRDFDEKVLAHLADVHVVNCGAYSFSHMLAPQIFDRASTEVESYAITEAQTSMYTEVTQVV